MKLTYDAAVDAAYIRISRDSLGAAVKTVPVDPRAVDGEINLDFDRDGWLIGIEVLAASQFLPRELLESASRP